MAQIIGDAEVEWLIEFIEGPKFLVLPKGRQHHNDQQPRNARKADLYFANWGAPQIQRAPP